MQTPAPVIVTDRFPELLDSLLDLLESLSPADWQRPTAAEGWTVKDMVAHLYGAEANILSGKRDRYSEPVSPLTSWEELVDFINLRNLQWVEASRRLSPRLLCDLIRYTGDQVNAYFRSLDVHQLGAPVSWASDAPAPVWLDIAREFTERWHHQQHIREAVNRPGGMQPAFLGPVLAAFLFALPRTYRTIEAPLGTAITITITGEAGGEWCVLRESSGWVIYSGQPEKADAGITLPPDTAWRLFTKGLTPSQARPHVQMTGDQALAEKALETVSIIG
jgi:uncharacterized protein (TIGR03083 family)